MQTNTNESGANKHDSRMYTGIPLSAQEHPNYNPNRLLDELMVRLKLRNDAALARCLGTNPAVISKIRHRRLGVAAWLLVSMQEETGMSIRELRVLGGDFRLDTRMQSPVVPPDGALTH